MYDVIFDSMFGGFKVPATSRRWSLADAWLIVECLRLNGFYARVVKRGSP